MLDSCFLNRCFSYSWSFNYNNNHYNDNDNNYNDNNNKFITIIINNINPAVFGVSYWRVERFKSVNNGYVRMRSTFNPLVPDVH